MRHEYGIFVALLPDRNAHGAGGICARNALAARSAFGGRRIALIAIAHTSSCPRLKQQRAHAKKRQACMPWRGGYAHALAVRPHAGGGGDYGTVAGPSSNV